MGQRGQGHSWKAGPEPSAVISQALRASGSSHSGSLSREHGYGTRLGEGVYSWSSILLPLTGAKPGPPDPDQSPTSQLGAFGEIALFYQIPGSPGLHQERSLLRPRVDRGSNQQHLIGWRHQLPNCSPEPQITAPEGGRSQDSILSQMTEVTSECLKGRWEFQG